MTRRRNANAWLLVKCVTGGTLVMLLSLVTPSSGHGRLIEPPSRASAWRYGFSTPPNYNDHELYCGGFNRQWQKNDGKCGECGDAYDVPKPRPHEYGGKWGQGVIVRRYRPGSVITLRVELTASHMGYFEFRICDSVKAQQDCLDKHLMKILSGTPSVTNPNDLKTRFYPRNGSRIYDMKAELPEDLQCSNCVIQWKYVAGNNWGVCPDGNGAVGCGPQEEFRACADVYVGDTSDGGNRTPIRPGQRPLPTRIPAINPEQGSSGGNGTDEQNADDELQPGVKYMGPLVAILSLFLVLCGFAALYIYHYHGGRIKALMRWNRNKNQKCAQHTEANAPSVEKPPVPPPRTKRISQQMRDIEAEESSVLTGSSKASILTSQLNI
ncbi:uncharacterized protein LOC131428200 [Malaya genurostris]|uniref:uncharacterized protein LOC131428200 n=1 Tax=Malaya genurostris TaxID=325434 RepID=UPI0026F38E0B|nr:uncharacterized protein LOC131428200 [Malaya genurostris]XP_058447917.1 uncharacterized protein LOC131428200 [Malaya genurostris]XP_058447918.1 uncharacterized protein LOC131428200 [Malaya genurostris]XP_058447919.1 uncharacterized protein LOC131428200 [Malaya genurostris]